MFNITDETCRRFSLAEILILAEMNVRTSGMGFKGNRRCSSVAAQTVPAALLVQQFATPLQA
jgi:hypothetical protein